MRCESGVHDWVRESRLLTYFSDETETSDVRADLARARLRIRGSFPNRGRQVAELLEARSQFE